MEHGEQLSSEEGSTNSNYSKANKVLILEDWLSNLMRYIIFFLRPTIEIEISHPLPHGWQIKQWVRQWKAQASELFYLASWSRLIQHWELKGLGERERSSGQDAPLKLGTVTPLGYLGSMVFTPTPEELVNWCSGRDAFEYCWLWFRGHEHWEAEGGCWLRYEGRNGLYWENFMRVWECRNKKGWKRNW